MQNLLIVEANLIESYFLINYICKIFANIRLYGVASTGMEAINILKEERIDIVILDLKLPDMTGIDVINFISKSNMLRYQSSIIAVTDDMKLLSQIAKNKYLFGYCLKNNSINFIINKIKDLLKENKKECQKCIINKQIKAELEILNFNFSYVGTKYLQECIYECYCKNVKYNINLNREIYPTVIKKYNKSIDLIRADIFQAISVMYNETKQMTLSKYFGYNVISKPKTKEIIITILEKLKNN